MVAQELVWLAILLGLISATVFPYVQKLLDAANKGEPIKFDMIYAKNLVVAGIVTALGNIFFFIDY